MAREGRKPKVVIFGASIAGLTAAHELAVRGFDVEVIEMATALGPDGTERAPALGGKVRTQYVVADLFSDPDSWEPSLPILTTTMPPSAPGWRPSMAQDHGRKTVGKPVWIEFEIPADPDENESEQLPDKKAAALLPIVDSIRSVCRDEASNMKAGANLAWYCLLIQGCQGPASRGNPSIAANLTAWMNQVEDALTKSKAFDPLKAEWLHPATGINVLRQSSVRRGAPDGRSASPAAGGSPGVCVSFGAMFPMTIRFEAGADGDAPRLSEDGERQVEAVGRTLDRVTVNYTRSPWLIVRILISVADARIPTRKKAERGARLVEGLLRARAHLVTTEPHRELIILHTTVEQPVSDDDCCVSRSGQGSSTTSELGFSISVDIKPTLPVDVEIDADEGTLTPDSAEALDTLDAAYRVIMSNPLWPRWFRWPFDQLGLHDSSLHAAVQEWLRTPETDAEGNTEISRKRSLTLLKTILPGEHRFFVVAPYERHIIDTLERIPLRPRPGRAEDRGATVAGRLKPLFGRGASDWGGSAARQDSQAIDLRTPTAFFARLRDDPGNFAQLLLRLLRYALTCPARREKELASLSFWEYIEGRDNLLGIPRYRYSDAFRRDLSLLCQIVTGMDAETGEARACADIFLQVLTTSIRPRPEPYRAFTMPVTEAWIDPWREYLKETLHVRFTHGQLVRLDPEGDTVGAYCKRFEGAEEEAYCDADYYVVATNAHTARELSWKLDGGVPEQLAAWLDAEEDAPPPAGRLKPLGGIQYFFVTDQRAKIEPTFFCLRDFGWSLTAVTSDKLWEMPPSVPSNGFTGMVSVGIHAWDMKAGAGSFAERTAWQCARHELAEEVWNRISPHLHAPGLRPRWYHIDDGMLYHDGAQATDAESLTAARNGKTGRSGAVVRCEAPYAIPKQGDWSKRPGALAPDRPSHERSRRPPEVGPGIYRHKLVFAGAYMKTYTRVPTPEAENESARHAVNAILLHHEANRGATHARPEHGKDVVFEEVWSAFGGSWERKAGLPLSDVAPASDLCAIWNPEEHELPELAKLRRNDELFFARESASIWDLAQVEALPMFMSWVSKMGRPGSWARPQGEQPPPSEQVSPWTSDALIRLMMSIREVIEQRLKVDTGPAGDPTT